GAALLAEPGFPDGRRPRRRQLRLWSRIRLRALPEAVRELGGFGIVILRGGGFRQLPEASRGVGEGRAAARSVRRSAPVQPGAGLRGGGGRDALDDREPRRG